jgi:hypothetical protein
MFEYSLKTDNLNVGQVVAGIRIYRNNQPGHITKFFSFLVKGNDDNDTDDDIQNNNTPENYMSMLYDARELLKSIVVTADENVESYINEISALIGDGNNFGSGAVTNLYYDEIKLGVPRSLIRGTNKWFTIAETNRTNVNDIGINMIIRARCRHIITNDIDGSLININGALGSPPTARGALSKFEGNILSTGVDNGTISGIRFVRHSYNSNVHMQLRFTQTLNGDVELFINRLCPNPAIQADEFVLYKAAAEIDENSISEYIDVFETDGNASLPWGTITNTLYVNNMVAPFSPIQWFSPVFINGFERLAALDQNIHFHYGKDSNGIVWMQGGISRPETLPASAGITIFHLPEGYRPSRNLNHIPAVLSLNTTTSIAVRISIFPSGQVTMYQTGNPGIGFGPNGATWSFYMAASFPLV